MKSTYNTNLLKINMENSLVNVKSSHIIIYSKYKLQSIQKASNSLIVLSHNMFIDLLNFNIIMKI